MWGIFDRLFGSVQEPFDWMLGAQFKQYLSNGLCFLKACAREEMHELDNSAWHEAGHVIGTFLVGCPVVHARINDRRNHAFVTLPKRYNRLPKEQFDIVHVGGWALERLHFSIEECKKHVGYKNMRKCNQNSDWHKLGMPTIEKMDELSKPFYDDGLLGLAEQIHDELVEKKRLARSDIKRLYGEFMTDGEILRSRLKFQKTIPYYNAREEKKEKH